MKVKILAICLLMPTLLCFSQETNDNPFSFKWDNGFKLQSEDGQFRLNFGGRIMVDHAYLYQDRALDQNFGPLQSTSATEIRRARFFISGDLYENTFFKFQVDFAGNETELKDVYIGLRNIPAVGRIMVGHFKEPFRLSTLTSSKYTTFMESGHGEAFSRSRNNGVMVLNDFLNERLSAQLGTFRNASNSHDVFANDGYIITGRITGLPLKNEKNTQLLHLGMAYSYRKPDLRKYQISARPSAHLAPKYIAVEELTDVEKIELLNFETAYVNGPFSLQAEYLDASVVNGNETFSFSSYYTELSYFLTGESKNYEGSYDGFGRVKPKNNFGKKGWGAWEMALLYTTLHLNDKTIRGGNQNTFGLGVNWYLNSATRFMVNYLLTDIEKKGTLNVIQGRLQIDF